MKKISVIIPVYNCEHTIIKALDSVIKQNYKYYEIIIVNDGSTDNSKFVIENYIKNTNSNIKLINIKNNGVSNARNIALDNITGDIVVFLDGDDYLLNDYFQNIIDNIADYDILVYGYINSYNNKDYIKIFSYDKTLNSKIEFYEKLNDNSLANPIANKVYTSKIVKDIRFNVQLDLGEDLDFFIKVLSKTNKYKYIDKAYYKYMVTNNGLGFKKRKTVINEKKAMYSNLIKLYKNENNNMQYINNLITKAYLQEFTLLYKNNCSFRLIEKYINEYYNSSFKKPVGLQFYIIMRLFSFKSTIIRKILCKMLILYDNKKKYKEFNIRGEK